MIPTGPDSARRAVDFLHRRLVAVHAGAALPCHTAPAAPTEESHAPSSLPLQLLATIAVGEQGEPKPIGSSSSSAPQISTVRRSSSSASPPSLSAFASSPPLASVNTADRTTVVGSAPGPRVRSILLLSQWVVFGSTAAVLASYVKLCVVDAHHGASERFDFTVTVINYDVRVYVHHARTLCGGLFYTCSLAP
eukprot:GHVT01005366.1.p1 GENE.GHVT01005366.1~~GHVT01005366.1.p1  ORF type:complete len:193 (-),score=28.94 GHVT01005366.1:884-1462(-)